MVEFVNIIGAGLAGCEAAWQLAERGIDVVLYDMKPQKLSPAHKTADFGELVCSNSLRSDDYTGSAIGTLHQEMRMVKSLIMECADLTRVPAGGALAVDREGFSKLITDKVKNHPRITVKNEEITALPSASFGRTIIATGPLTSEALSKDILKQIGGNAMYFYDAIAPVVYKDSIDFSKAWYQSRYDKGDKFDYINCPMNKEQYYTFIEELTNAEKMAFHNFEADVQYFDGCLPIEVMAVRGPETLRYGPMKPVGLTNPNSAEKPYAVVQLRQDNKADTLRNIVGFQTKLKYPEQKRIFKTIPGLENAEFAKFGGIHKNTYINSPPLLDTFLRLKSMPHISFAGQITGCEGYVESAAIGLLAGYFAASGNPVLPPRTTALGSLHNHLIEEKDQYKPMNINFGLFPTITHDENGRRIKNASRKQAYCKRALHDIKPWVKEVLD